MGRPGLRVSSRCPGLLCLREVPQRGLLRGGMGGDTGALPRKDDTLGRVRVAELLSSTQTPSPPPTRSPRPGRGRPVTCLLLLATPIRRRAVPLWGLHFLVYKMGIKAFPSQGHCEGDR